jgi:hypothetical protein
VSESSFNERAAEATGPSGAMGADTAPAGESSEAARPREQRSRTVDSGPLRDTFADRPVSGSERISAGSDLVSADATKGRYPQVSAGGVEPFGTSGVAPETAGDALVSNGGSFRSRWSSVQVGFVDDPRRAVDEAEQLVTDVVADLVDGFRQHRQRLEAGRDGSTDEMRMVFQRYRDFFDRLLNV